MLRTNGMIVRPNDYQNHRMFGTPTQLFESVVWHETNSPNGDDSMLLRNHYIRDEHTQKNIIINVICANTQHFHKIYYIFHLKLIWHDMHGYKKTYTLCNVLANTNRTAVRSISHIGSKKYRALRCATASAQTHANMYIPGNFYLINSILN